MTWIIINFVFFAWNLFFAITGTDHGWIIFSAFSAGLSFGIFIMLLAQEMGNNDKY